MDWIDWVAERKKRIAERMIDNSEIPRTCDKCWFNHAQYYCELINNNISNFLSPQCTVYDFTKYLLEHI